MLLITLKTSIPGTKGVCAAACRLQPQGIEALQAGNRHGKGIPLYDNKREKGCVDLPESHEVGVS